MSAGNAKPMTLSEKILCHQAVGLTKPSVVPGETIVVRVSRTLACELTLVGIQTCLQSIGNPEIWRNDRFFLACDHSVDPKNYNEEVIKRRIKMCSDFSAEHNLTDYAGPNDSILHTEFYRQKAIPGTVIVGADSHSCSHGCIGAYAMGMGASDVTMPLVTGTTWLTVPETVLIEFVGDLKWGFVGKDVMLYILKQFKRNTVALDRCVEFGGNIAGLDIDSRFAISNMATEFGAIAGIFPADELTQGFLDRRSDIYGSQSQATEQCKNGASHTDKNGDICDTEETAMFFRADPDANYYKKLKLDLSEMRDFLVARWPSPDHVFSISDPALYEPLYDEGKKVCETIRYLDGCFIGACTTTENEIILAGLVLEVMMDVFGIKQRNDKPYKRQVTPGSRVMIERLERLGILSIYRRAGFSVGAAGCSYCLGVAHDKAKEGEIWLSSQNRNFKHRMGKGAIGSVTSAAVVAASSFYMEIRDPSEYIVHVDPQRYADLTGQTRRPCKVVEPQLKLVEVKTPADEVTTKISTDTTMTKVIRGKVQRFGDSVDTDAVIPAQYIPLRGTEQGEKSFVVAKPEFVRLVHEGYKVVVAGEGFGCGSSREEAVSCLKFAGVEAVIAKSFSFIYGRNLLTMNLFGITIKEDRFYELATEGVAVEIDAGKGRVCVQNSIGNFEEFAFSMSPIQEVIYDNGGIIQMFGSKGKELYGYLAEVSQRSMAKGSRAQRGCALDQLAW